MYRDGIAIIAIARLTMQVNVVGNAMIPPHKFERGESVHSNFSAPMVTPGKTSDRDPQPS